MSDLNFDNFKRYLDESHTEEGRERQRKASEAALIKHGRAHDLEVEDEGEVDAQATLPPPLKKAGQQESDTRDDDPPPPAQPATTVEDRWATLRQKHGTTSFG